MHTMKESMKLNSKILINYIILEWSNYLWLLGISQQSCWISDVRWETKRWTFLGVPFINKIFSWKKHSKLLEFCNIIFEDFFPTFLLMLLLVNNYKINKICMSHAHTYFHTWLSHTYWFYRYSLSIIKYITKKRIVFELFDKYAEVI